MKETNDGKKGGLLDGEKHTNGGIEAVVTDTGAPVELEAGEIIINSEASKLHWKALDEINQSAGDGVPIAKPIGGVAKKGGAIQKQAYIGEIGGNTGGLGEPNTNKGWFRNPHDSKWRFEINDSEMELLLPFDRLADYVKSNKTELNYAYKISRVLSHPELFKYYPFIKDILVNFVYDEKSDSPASLLTYKSQKTAILKYNFYGEERFFRLREDSSESSVRSRSRKNFFIHEIQHIIQIREEMGGGSTVHGQFEQILLEQKLDEKTISQTERDILWAKAIQRNKNSSGEIESKDVENRLEYTDEQRKYIEPLSSISVDKKYLNVHKEDNIFALGGSITNTELDKAMSDLHRAEKSQATMKSANAIIRSKKDVQKRLEALGLSPDQAAKLQTPDFANRIGFPTYALTNNNANIKRLQDRVNTLEKKLEGAKAVSEGKDEKYSFEGGEVEVNYALDRVQILFPGGRVDKELFQKLRKNGYVYSPTNLAFQRKITPQAISNAIHLFGAKRVVSDSNNDSESAKVEPVEEKSLDYEKMLTNRNFSYVSGYIYKALPKGYTGATHFNVVVFELRKDLVIDIVKAYVKKHIPELEIDKVEVSVYPKTYVLEAKKLYKEGAYLPSTHPAQMVLGNMPQNVKNFMAMEKDMAIREQEEVAEELPSIQEAFAAESSKPNVPAKQYVTVSQSYFTGKGAIGEVLSKPNMFVQEIYFGKDKTGKELIAKVDNNYITKMIGVPEIVIDGKSLSFVLAKAEVIPHNVLNDSTGIAKKAVDSELPKGGELTGVTVIEYEDNGDTLIYGTKNNRVRVPVKGMSNTDIQNEINFERKILEKSKKEVESFDENAILNTRGLTSQEKADAIKMHKQSMLNNDRIEKIVIPFYESKLKSVSKEETLLPNTPEEFDEVIMENIDPYDSWIGSLIKERDVKQQIYKQLNGPENIKETETERIFELYKAKQSKPEPKTFLAFQYGDKFGVPKGHDKELQLELIKQGFELLRTTNDNNGLIVKWTLPKGDIEYLVYDNGGEFNIENETTGEFIDSIAYDTTKGIVSPADLASDILYIVRKLRHPKRPAEKTLEIKNLLPQLQAKFVKTITEFGITEIFMDQYNELHIASEYDVPADYVEAIEKEIKEMKKTPAKHIGKEFLDVDWVPSGANDYVYKRTFVFDTEEKAKQFHREALKRLFGKNFAFDRQISDDDLIKHDYFVNDDAHSDILDALYMEVMPIDGQIIKSDGIASEEIIYPNSQNEEELDIDPTYDVAKGIKYKEFFNKYYGQGLKEKFGIKEMIFNDLKLHLIFANGKGQLDFSRGLRPEDYSGTNTWDKLQDIEYFLHNAINHSDEEILANVQSPSKHWISNKKSKPEMKEKSLGQISGGWIIEYADIEPEIIHQLQMQGFMEEDAATELVKGNKAFAKDQIGLGLSAEKVAKKMLDKFTNFEVPELVAKPLPSLLPKLEDIILPSDVFKGITATYKNQYVLNKAIEAFLTNKKDNYTSDEKNWIRKYSGYGGLDKYGTTGKGGLFEYYTPKEIIEKMWALAYKFGYNNGSVLEPSVATGEFFQFAPKDIRMVGYEINEYSAQICKILYPTAEIILQPFEKTFIGKDNFSMKGKTNSLEQFDLVIGNPPYGDFSTVASRYMTGMGEKDYTKARNYVEYFIRRGLDLVKPGGLLIYIVGSALQGGGKMFLDGDLTPVKEYLSEHCEFLDAYRLPDSVFERTGVTADILVLRKL